MLYGVRFNIISYTNLENWKDIINLYEALNVDIRGIIDFNEVIEFELFYNNELEFQKDLFKLRKSEIEPNIMVNYDKIKTKYSLIHICPIPGQDFNYLKTIKSLDNYEMISFQVHITALIKYEVEYREAIENVDILFVNEEEALFITRQDSIDSALDILLRKSNKTYIITSHNKNIVISQGKIYTSSSLVVDVVDPTGAGDAFAGGFIAGYLVSKDFNLALRYGTMAATIKLTSYSSDSIINFLKSGYLQ